MTLKAILFDVDGTLADTERDGHRIAFNQTFRQFGLDWDWDVELYGKLLKVTGGKERIRYYVDNWKIEKPANLDELIPQLHQHKTQCYVDILEGGNIPMRPGIRRLILEAKERNIRLAVVTTTTAENVTTLLRESLDREAVGWFDVIAAGDIVPQKKPAPDIYFWALENLGLNAAECIALEDSENGFKSSMAAKVRTVVTVNDYTRNQEFPGACAVLSDLGEPDSPFKVLQGSAHGKSYADVDLLMKWQQK